MNKKSLIPIFRRMSDFNLVELRVNEFSGVLFIQQGLKIKLFSMFHVKSKYPF